MRYARLDLVRGGSALIVVAEHLRNATMVDFQRASQSPAWIKGFYFVTGLGHQAVVVFFVLSGFFVGGAALKAGIQFQWTTYLSARLSRLWTVLIPCLLLTYVVDNVVWATAPSVLDGAFAETWHSAPQSGAYDASLATAVGNLLFLQTIVVPVYGSNGPLWSLANEFWYYMLFPLMAMAAAKIGERPTVMRRLACALLAVLVLCFIPFSMLSGYMVWLLGLAVFAARRELVAFMACHFRAAAAGLFGLFAACLVLSRLRIIPGVAWGLPDLLLGSAFAAVCAVLIVPGAQHAAESRFDQFSSALAQLSYTLYLSHFPLVMLIGAEFYRNERMPANGASVLVFTGWLVLLLCVCWALWWLFERNTSVVRQYVDLLVGQVSAARRRSRI
ncbi:acyltransferase family protein [Ralstonia soli]|uniref:Acyltransferase n=1 Tax=Ralstonia soli TaxID=2953896 RepID=A0ABT1AQE7_9RALS|nr:acyltransferase [Ralstonia soli]MCO5400620.1 acyltransferase [Ralstonia soli]